LKYLSLELRFAQETATLEQIFSSFLNKKALHIQEEKINTFRSNAAFYPIQKFLKFSVHTFSVHMLMQKHFRRTAVK
jgi:hypothetical protein